jgi:uncharacterized LabA/DUF88 family protein
MVNSPVEAGPKRATVFFDGQNLFYAAKEAFGYSYPNYDIRALAEWACRQGGWQLQQARFYTGVPSAQDDERWNTFWSRKLGAMGRAGVHVYSRPLRYRNQTLTLPDGTQKTVLVGQEKGIDVRLALDIIRLAHQSAYDVAVVFSQDQDLSEVADEIRAIAREQSRWIKMASAFPASPTSRNRRGINKTDWLAVTRETYDACLDRRDYRDKQ